MPSAHRVHDPGGIDLDPRAVGRGVAARGFPR